MALLRRRPLPDAIKAVVLPPGERRLAWALTQDDQPVVATELALLLPAGPRLTWAAIERVSWQRPALLVVEGAEIEGMGARHALRLTGDGDLPGVVYSRVTGSVAWQRHERLSPAGGVRLVGRRQPGRDDLAWQLVFDQGTDRTDPLVREQADQLLVAARRSIG